MDGELGGAAARGHRLRNATYVDDWDYALDLLFVDVNHSVVCDRNHTLLGPLELVNLLHKCGVDESVLKEKSGRV